MTHPSCGFPHVRRGADFSGQSRALEWGTQQNGGLVARSPTLSKIGSSDAQGDLEWQQKPGMSQHSLGIFLGDSLWSNMASWKIVPSLRWMEGDFIGKVLVAANANGWSHLLQPDNRDRYPFSFSSNKWPQHRKWPGKYLALASIKDCWLKVYLDLCTYTVYSIDPIRLQNVRDCGNINVMILYQLFMESYP